jgi:hypothetical protein
MWPFKPNKEKIIKKLQQKEYKIQQLTMEAENLAMREYTNKNANRLASIDEKIKSLKEEMIKMGKLVLKDGKLMKEEVANKLDKKEDETKMINIPPPYNNMNESTANEVEAQINQLEQQQLYQEQLKQQQLYQEQLKQQQLYQEQLKQQQLYQEQLKQPESNEQIVITIYYNNSEPSEYSIPKIEVEDFLKTIIDAIDNKTALIINNRIINPDAIDYVEY